MLFGSAGVASGDLGFTRDGHLYVVGRGDDVISIAGRKVHAHDIERAVERFSEIRPGCSTLVSWLDDGRQRISLLVEPKTSADEYQRVADAAAKVAMSTGAVALDECVFLERGRLPKTPSGKIQRHRCRSLRESGRLSPLATISLAES